MGWGKLWDSGQVGLATPTPAGPLWGFPPSTPFEVSAIFKNREGVQAYTCSHGVFRPLPFCMSSVVLKASGNHCLRRIVWILLDRLLRESFNDSDFYLTS